MDCACLLKDLLRSVVSLLRVALRSASAFFTDLTEVRVGQVLRQPFIGITEILFVFLRPVPNFCFRALLSWGLSLFWLFNLSLLGPQFMRRVQDALCCFGFLPIIVGAPN